MNAASAGAADLPVRFRSDPFLRPVDDLPEDALSRLELDDLHVEAAGRKELDHAADGGFASALRRPEAST